MILRSLEELHEKAIKEIKGEKGVITINIAGIPKISRSNDVIGNCVQEWIVNSAKPSHSDLNHSQ